MVRRCRTRLQRWRELPKIHRQHPQGGESGDDVTGRVIEEDSRKIVVVTDPLKQTQREIRKSEIQERRPSRLSPMPEGLVSILTKEEILDLLAYIESGGKPTAAEF